MTSSLPLFLVLLGCSKPLTGDILAIGDSILDWNRKGEASIPAVVGSELGLEVANAAVSGALFTGDLGRDIRDQYQEGDWTWLIVDGGGNDVNMECFCADCGSTVDELISADGQSGAIPEFAAEVLTSGTRVAFLGYYRMPSSALSGFGKCNDEIAVFRERLELWDASESQAIFVDAGEVVRPADLAAYDDDHVHPSEKGGRLVGAHLAEAIRQAEAAETTGSAGRTP